MTPKIILIDHNDSFTNNIVEVFRTLKQEITVINYSDLSIKAVKNFDKIILSPGPMLPKDYPKTFTVIKKYFKEKSFLGICLGQQAICEFFNAKLQNLHQVKHGVEQEIEIQKKSKLFKDIPNIINVGLYHSWIVNDINFPKELIITSKTNDNLIMSIEHRQYSIYGIQFHPESFLTKYGKQIIKNFISL
jgi:para-aminobenzoate synthetase component 2